MNSYKTLAAAAHISGIPVRYAVSFGQAFHAGHYSTVKSFGDLVHREQIAGDYVFPAHVHRDLIEQFQQAMAAFPGAPRILDGVYLSYPNAPRVDHDPVGRWNAEDKERQLKLRGKRADMLIVDDVERDAHEEFTRRSLGGVAAAAAGGTSQPSYVVRVGEDPRGKWEVVNTRTNNVHLHFKQWRWANVTAQAYNAGQTPRQFMDAWNIPHAKWTLQ